jgi:hypothetical protein
MASTARLMAIGAFPKSVAIELLERAVLEAREEVEAEREKNAALQRRIDTLNRALNPLMGDY